MHEVLPNLTKHFSNPNEFRHMKRTCNLMKGKRCALKRPHNAPYSEIYFQKNFYFAFLFGKSSSRGFPVIYKWILFFQSSVLSNKHKNDNFSSNQVEANQTSIGRSILAWGISI